MGIIEVLAAIGVFITAIVAVVLFLWIVIEALKGT